MLVDITGPARRDLKAIATHTRKTWGVEQRDHYMAAINLKFMRLARHPKLGAIRNGLPGTRRALLVGGHIIFYRITDEALVIDRILHQARDISAEFK